MSTNPPPQQILAAYLTTPAETISRLGEGNINDTFLICNKDRNFILQRINGDVFPNPDILIENLRQLSAHLQTKGADCGQRWEDIRLLPTRDGAFAKRDSSGSLWRAISYVEDSCTLPRIETIRQAEQVGWALGHFHRRV